MVENGADIHACTNFALITSSENVHIEIIKFLISFDLKYYSNKSWIIEFVLKNKLVEFYENFGIDTEKIPQTKDDILKYTNSNDFESIKKCRNFDFSTEEYYLFFKCLSKNNTKMIELIFGFIEDKNLQ